MIEGKYLKPYVYRTLLPTTVRCIYSCIPEDVKNNWTDFVCNIPKVLSVLELLNWPKELSLKLFIASVFVILFYIGFGYTISEFIFLFIQSGNKYILKSIISGISLILLPGFFRYGFHLYDAPQLFLFTLAIYLLYRGKFGLFYVVYILAVINKETSVLLALIFVVYYFKKIPSGKLIWLFVLFVFTFILVKTFLLFVFEKNGGSFLEYHYLENNLRSVLALVMNSGFLILLLCLSLYKWKYKPIFLKTSFLIVALPLIISTIFFGIFDEIRVYYELYPMLITLSVISFKI
ncbi:MAG: hypothetical protein NTY74_15880 [Ignavibacteriae bacterium]|nr:hypothetical protein [Ignavibacteriota bacterium]